MKKGDIRKYIKEQKRQISDEYKLMAAAAAFEKLENTEIFKQADNVLMYNSLPDEISTHSFIEKWHNKKHLYLPRVNGDELDILPYVKDDTHVGAFNIEEPNGEALSNVDNIDLIVVPGVAFDCQRNRVGRGKGYYDRLLTESKAPKIGMAYDFQIVEDIETEPHDIPVDMVLTDKREIR